MSGVTVLLSYLSHQHKLTFIVRRTSRLSHTTIIPWGVHSHCKWFTSRPNVQWVTRKICLDVLHGNHPYKDISYRFIYVSILSYLKLLTVNAKPPSFNSSQFTEQVKVSFRQYFDFGIGYHLFLRSKVYGLYIDYNTYYQQSTTRR